MSARRLIAQLDALGWLRERGDGHLPNPVLLASLAEQGGACGVSLRLESEPDTRADRDARLLREIGLRRYLLVLPCTSGGLKSALELRPDAVIWTAESARGGIADPLDLLVDAAPLASLMRAIGEARIESRALVPADAQQVKAAHRSGMAGVCLSARGAQGAPSAAGAELSGRVLEEGARLAVRLGLSAAVLGIGSLEQMRDLASLDALTEFHVGDALVAHALGVGMERAARDFAACLES